MLASLSSYDFPGNIRELQSLIHNAVSSQSFDSLSAITGFKGGSSIPKNKKTFLSPGLQISEKTTDNLIFGGSLPSLDRAGEMLIEEAMRRSGGNQTLAAKMIGISRQTLIRYLKKKQNT
jgi:transcriptional regulator with PAS, ATPase and Fis domain